MVETLIKKGYKVQGPFKIFLIKKTYHGASRPDYLLRTTIRGFGVHSNCDNLEFVELDPETLDWMKVER